MLFSSCFWRSITDRLPSAVNLIYGSRKKQNGVIELNSLSLDELKKLQKDIDRAIESFEAHLIAAARAELEARAKELSVTLKQIMDESGTKKVKKPVPVKYRNPNNPEETWTGLGRKQRWLTVTLTSIDAKLEDFQVWGSWPEAG